MGSVVIGIVKLNKKRADTEKNPTVIKIDNERYLTSGEIAMAKLIFKDSIDYYKVKIIRGGILGAPDLAGAAMTPAGHIHLPNQEYLKNKDFSSKEKNTAEDKHWFIHEMTHVWQYQMGANIVWHWANQFCRGGYVSTVHTTDTPKNGDIKAYTTDISASDANKKFNEFNFEQQGRIIEFWYDACYLQLDNPQRSHHQRSLQLLGYTERILREFLYNPKDKNLLPRI